MYKLLRPVLFSLDAETTHERMRDLGQFVAAARLGFLLRPFFVFDDPALHTNFLGLEFKNPVGNAAGFDKNARIVDFLPDVGFGYMEIGSITAQARPGNPRPRLFRLPADEALINRLGQNNPGADAMAQKLSGRRFRLPLGINIDKTHDPRILGDEAIADFVYSFKTLSQFGDYITINISCPNTTEGKTFEQPEALDKLLSALMPLRPMNPKKPILVKFSPDLTFEALDAALDVAERHGVDGYIIGNTSLRRDGLKTTAADLEKMGKGGLSGEPIRAQTTALIAHAYKKLQRPCIIGLGGIDSAEDAYEKIRAGASLVQIYTGLVYQGPSLIKKINQGLVELLKKDGFKNLAEAVGKN